MRPHGSAEALLFPRLLGYWGRPPSRVHYCGGPRSATQVVTATRVHVHDGMDSTPTKVGTPIASAPRAKYLRCGGRSWFSPSLAGSDNTWQRRRCFLPCRDAATARRWAQTWPMDRRCLPVWQRSGARCGQSVLGTRPHVAGRRASQCQHRSPAKWRSAPEIFGPPAAVSKNSISAMAGWSWCVQPLRHAELSGCRAFRLATPTSRRNGAPTSVVAIGTCLPRFVRALVRRRASQSAGGERTASQPRRRRARGVARAAA
jgi:hypothetical protein